MQAAMPKALNCPRAAGKGFRVPAAEPKLTAVTM